MSDKHTPQVVLAWCHNGSTRAHFTECYAEVRLIDSHRRRLIDASERPLIAEGVWLDKNRNLIARMFLERREPWLMFLDTDMLFTVSQFYQLYDQAVTLGPGVHAGLYYGLFNSYLRSTWARKYPTHVEFIAERRGKPRDDLDGVGMGFTLIHRDVFEVIAKVRPKYLDVWFSSNEIVDPVSGEIADGVEDYSFCERAKAAGFKIYGHDNICLGHDKQTIVTWETFDREQVRLELVRAKAT